MSDAEIAQLRLGRRTSERAGSCVFDGALRAMGLTPREHEVAALVLRGLEKMSPQPLRAT